MERLYGGVPVCRQPMRRLTPLKVSHFGSCAAQRKVGTDVGIPNEELDHELLLAALGTAK